MTRSSDDDHRLRRLVQEMVNAAPSPPAWDELPGGQPPTIVQRRFGDRRWIVVAAAAACVLGALAFVVPAVLDDGDDHMMSPAPASTDVVAPPTNDPSRSSVAPDTTASPPTTTSTTTTVASSSPVTSVAPVGLSCTEPVMEIARRLVEERTTGRGGMPCVAPDVIGAAPTTPPCWVRCGDGTAVLTVETQGSAVDWESPLEGTRGSSLRALVTYRGPDGETSRTFEDWAFTRDGAGRFTLTSLRSESTAPREQQALEIVREYLDHLAGGDYAAAASLLAGDGGVDWPEREDLAQLPELPADRAELADVLAEICAVSHVCEVPASLSTRVEPTGAVVVTATYRSPGGAPLVAEYRGSLYEGTPAVFGVPPARP